MRTVRSINQLAADKAEINMFAFPFSTDSERFLCKITHKFGGDKVEISRSAPTYEEAISMAVMAYDKLVNKGVPELASPMIEYQPPASPGDDEITF